MAGKHTISRAGQIYAGDVISPNHQEGRIGAPLGNALVRFRFTGVEASVATTTLTTATPANQRIPVMLDVAVRDSAYPMTTLGPVLRFASAGNESGKLATIWGTDNGGMPATKTVALTNAGSVDTPIGWQYIDAFQLSAGLAGNVTVTAIGKFSFPYAVWGDGDEVQNLYVDGSVIGSPSYTTARTTADDITGADGRGILDLTGAGLSDSTVVFTMYVDRTSHSQAVGLPTYSDIPVYNYVS